MLMTKWTNRITSFWMEDNLWFDMGLVGVLLLISDMLKLSGIEALGWLPVATMYQVGYGEMGVEVAEKAVRGSELSRSCDKRLFCPLLCLTCRSKFCFPDIMV